jgi:hypothetical protein
VKGGVDANDVHRQVLDVVVTDRERLVDLAEAAHVRRDGNRIHYRT